MTGFTMADGVLRKVEINKTEIPFMTVKKDNLLKVSDFVRPYKLVIEYDKDNNPVLYVLDDHFSIELKLGDIICRTDVCDDNFIHIFNPDTSDFIPIYNKYLYTINDEYAKKDFDMGNENPYDKDIDVEVDIYHKIARGVLSNLMGRRCISQTLEEVSSDIRKDMVKNLASIIKYGVQNNLEEVI